MIYILNIILPIFYLSFCFLFFRFLQKRNILVVHKHPYTNRNDRFVYFVYIQWCLFLLIVLFSFFLFHPFIVSFISLLFFLFTYVSLLKVSKNPKGSIIKEWHYTKEEQAFWDEQFKHEKKSFFYRSSSSPKVVFTEAFIFLSKRTYFSVRMRKFNDHLELTNVDIKGNFLIFTYTLQKSIPLRFVYVFIPKGKKKEAKQLVSTYQSLLK